MGAGVLYGRESWLNQMPPYQFGGEMVDKVAFSDTSFNTLPFKFEAGTPNVEAVLGMESALKFISETGYEFITSHEHALLEQATHQLAGIAGMRFLDRQPKKPVLFRFWSGIFILSTWAHCSIKWALRCAPVTIVRSLSWIILAYPEQCAPRWLFITPSKKLIILWSQSGKLLTCCPEGIDD